MAKKDKKEVKSDCEHDEECCDDECAEECATDDEDCCCDSVEPTGTVTESEILEEIEIDVEVPDFEIKVIAGQNMKVWPDGRREPL